MTKNFIHILNFVSFSVTICLFLLVLSCDNQANNGFVLKNGDLLFQDMDCGPLCDAIESVTQGYQNDRISHVGIVSIENDTDFVIEATGNGVVKTVIDSFLTRSLDKDGNPKVIVGRLNDSLQYLVPKALEYAKSFLGKQYDQKFEMNDSAFYCSELVYRIFYLANNLAPVFKLFPMTYKTPGDTTIMPVWTDYFNDLNYPVPEGKPGCNPAGISKNKNLHIVHEYGKMSRNQ